jgi:zinc protease
LQPKNFDVLDRSIAPSIHNATDFDFVLQPLQTLSCKNGMPIYYINGGAQEVISVEWIFEAGSWYAPQYSVAQAVASLLKSGTSSKTALQIDEFIEFYGGNVKVGCGNDFANIQLTCMSKHLRTLLPLIKEIIIDAQFPQHELDLHNQNYLQRLKVNLTKGDFVANRKIDEFLFGYAHPYGYYNTESTVAEVTSDALRAFVKNYYSSARCRMFVAGNYSDDVIQAIETEFGNEAWNSTDAMPTPTHAVKSEVQKVHRIQNDPKAMQGAIRIAKPFVNRQHPDFAQLILLNTVYGGYFGSRLMSNIREEKGYTYGIYSYMYNNRFDGAFSINTEAGKDVSEATVAEVFKEMDLLCKKPISNDEIQLVKNYILGNLLGDMDGPFQIIGRWKNLILNNFTVEQFDKNIQIYKSTRPEELQSLAQKYFSREDFYELIVY